MKTNWIEKRKRSLERLLKALQVKSLETLTNSTIAIYISYGEEDNGQLICVKAGTVTVHENSIFIELQEPFPIITLDPNLRGPGFSGDFLGRKSYFEFSIKDLEFRIGKGWGATTIENGAYSAIQENLRVEIITPQVTTTR